MTILCGTDFSPAARRALVAAAHVARMRRTGVRLIHVLDIPGAAEVLAERVESKVTEFLESEERRLLADLAAEAAHVKGVAPVECAVLAGRPGDVLLAEAARRSAELVCISAVGRRGDRPRFLGRTADRIAQRAGMPVLVVRDERPFRDWSSGARPLRVLVGLDLSPTSDAALRWLLTLRSAGPLVLTGAHVFWPPDVRERFQKEGLAIGAADPDVEAALESELRARAGTVHADHSALRIRLIGGMGRVSAHLNQLAAEDGADVLVIGTHQRQGLERLWSGSVSRDAIVGGDGNVVVVPA